MKNYFIFILLLFFKTAGYGNEFPLHEATSNGDAETVKLLLEKGMDVDATVTNDYTPLHIAIFLGHLEVAKILIENDADVNARDKDGNTALHFAFAVTTYNMDVVVQFLIENGADVNAGNEYGHTALMLARKNGFSEIVDLLKKHGATG